MGWNYLKYDEGWPVALGGLDAASSAGSILSLPSWFALTIAMSMPLIRTTKQRRTRLIFDRSMVVHLVSRDHA